jgi:hypothetical protein
MTCEQQEGGVSPTVTYQVLLGSGDGKEGQMVVESTKEGGREERKVLGAKEEKRKRQPPGRKWEVSSRPHPSAWRQVGRGCRGPAGPRWGEARAVEKALRSGWSRASSAALPEVTGGQMNRQTDRRRRERGDKEKYGGSKWGRKGLGRSMCAPWGHTYLLLSLQSHEGRCCCPPRSWPMCPGRPRTTSVLN